ncbi:DUF4554 domain-containing protein isoform X2 [Etheostoma cragini]|uniref:DUF4554 domain-containing protein isoform X2 n=1 Tax=Etheostoma cragini TaxID=417921 RepID=UPI00155E1A34|nr:DUF4554 domain-containing protein isoform X2 [Etheostoma cragini]
MLREIQQVLRLIMLLGEQKQQHSLKTRRGLLVLLWTETGASVQSLNCTVAAAGPWSTGIKMEALQPVLTDLKESMFPCTWPSPQPDPEELCAFTDLYGSLRLLLSFQVNVHLKFKLNQQTFQRDLRVKIKRTVALANQLSRILDVTCSTQPPGCVKKGCWCQGGHPVVGGLLPLSIPPKVMDQGLFGELSIQPVTMLSPCLLQYPNLATQLTHIKVLVFGPSNVPVAGPSTFFQNLPAHLDCQELGLHGLHCSSFKDHVHSRGMVYTVEQEPCKDPEQGSSLLPVQQSLWLYLFLQHSDPFNCHLSDLMATEVLIEHYLEDILNNNRQSVTKALQTELKNTLKAQNHRKRGQEELRSAADVILSSSISVVSCSSDVDFRTACLNSMKVRDTHELSASLHESLRRVTSWKFTPRDRCYSAQMEEHPESDDATQREI